MESVVAEEVPGSDLEEDPDFDFDFEVRPRSASEGIAADVALPPRCLSVPLPPPRTFADFGLGRCVRWAKAKEPERCYFDFRGELQPSMFRISARKAPIDLIPKIETIIESNNDDNDSAVRASLVRDV